MRLRKTIKLDDREITVYELRAKDLRKLMIERTNQLVEGADILTLLQEDLSLACDLPTREFEELAPSEIKTIWDAFKEVNAVFLNALRDAGLLELLRKATFADLSAALPGSSSAGTSAPGPTDGASS